MCRRTQKNICAVLTDRSRWECQEVHPDARGTDELGFRMIEQAAALLCCQSCSPTWQAQGASQGHHKQAHDCSAAAHLELHDNAKEHVEILVDRQCLQNIDAAQSTGIAHAHEPWHSTNSRIRVHAGAEQKSRIWICAIGNCCCWKVDSTALMNSAILYRQQC